MNVNRVAADLCVGIYAYPGFPVVTWDHFDPGLDDGVCWALKVVDGFKHVIFRGSSNLPDWLHDFDAWAMPIQHTVVGPVHPGAARGLDTVAGELCKIVSAGDWGVRGHSLGAMHASLTAAYMTVLLKPPADRIVFGEPKSGFKKACDLYRGFPGSSFCAGDTNGHDLVVNAVMTFWPEEYDRATPLVHTEVTPAPNDPWGLFRYHHMPGYRDAIYKEFP